MKKTMLGVVFLGGVLYLYGMNQNRQSLPKSLSEQYIKIPMLLDKDEKVIIPDGKVENGSLFLKLDNEEPLTTKTYREIINNKKGLPFIIAVTMVRGNNNNKVYRIYDAESFNSTVGLTDRYKAARAKPEAVEVGNRKLVNSASSASTILVDPINQIAIEGPIRYYALFIPDKPFVAIGIDIDFFKKPSESDIKKYMDLVFKASNGDGAALNQLGLIYKSNSSSVIKDVELSEYFLKKSIEIEPSKQALFNLGILYIENERGPEAEQYLNQAIGHGSTRAYYALGVLYENGTGGIPVDKEKAKELYEKALKHGLPDDIKLETEERLRNLNGSSSSKKSDSQKPKIIYGSLP